MPRFALFAALAAALVLAGCSVKSNSSGGGQTLSPAPSSGAKPTDTQATAQLGFPVSATRNTTRVSGSDPVADAAGVASALFPAGDPGSRPSSVALVDKADWQGAVAAGVLAGPAGHAPILLTDGNSIPTVTADTVQRLGPKRAILVGDKPTPPSGVASTVIRGTGGDPYSEAAAIDRFSAVAQGKASGDVVIASGEQAPYAVPAAPWAARSGDSVLFVQRDQVPKPTITALREHQHPRIWVLGPPSVISQNVVNQLGKLGTVKRISGANPVDNAIAFSRFQSSGFGWGAQIPGQNLSLASTTRPADAAAAAGLGTNGIFAPLVLTDNAQRLPSTLEGYLLDLEPGFQGNGPTRDQGVYDHIWILGASDVISQQQQSRADSAVALVPVDQTSR